tara:strand:- start:41003 stop:41659 length:657 start_codon:yes stop_codon:yes gene_type:complete
MIELFTAATPNGYKISIALEELGVDYKVKKINFSSGEQKEDWFLKINPNGRIPAIIDHDNGLSIFESGAILLYLADKYKKLISQDPVERIKCIEWLMFQMGGIGPMQGQANVFGRYFEKKIPSAISRYRNECRRLYTVLDNHLNNKEWICDEYSIADIANWCWVRIYKWSEVDITGLDNLRLWMDRMQERPACIKGCQVPPRAHASTQVKSAKSMIQK